MCRAIFVGVLDAMKGIICLFFFFFHLYANHNSELPRNSSGMGGTCAPHYPGPWLAALPAQAHSCQNLTRVPPLRTTFLDQCFHYLILLQVSQRQSRHEHHRATRSSTNLLEFLSRLCVTEDRRSLSKVVRGLAPNGGWFKFSKGLKRHNR